MCMGSYHNCSVERFTNWKKIKKRLVQLELLLRDLQWLIWLRNKSTFFNNTYKYKNVIFIFINKAIKYKIWDEIYNDNPGLIQRESLKKFPCGTLCSYAIEIFFTTLNLTSWSILTSKRQCLLSTSIILIQYGINFTKLSLSNQTRKLMQFK